MTDIKTEIAIEANRMTTQYVIKFREEVYVTDAGTVTNTPVFIIDIKNGNGRKYLLSFVTENRMNALELLQRIRASLVIYPEPIETTETIIAEYEQGGF